LRRFGGGLALVARRFLAGACGGAKNFVKSIFARRTDVGLERSLVAGARFARYEIAAVSIFLSGRRRSRGSPVRLLLSRLASQRAMEHAPSL
jgi:hypothetical protein